MCYHIVMEFFLKFIYRVLQYLNKNIQLIESIGRVDIWQYIIILMQFYFLHSSLPICIYQASVVKYTKEWIETIIMNCTLIFFLLFHDLPCLVTSWILNSSKYRVVELSIRNIILAFQISAIKWYIFTKKNNKESRLLLNVLFLNLGLFFLYSCFQMAV